MTSMHDDAGQIFKILIVDDSDADRLTYQRYLANAQITDCVLESDCGEIGLELCLTHCPDIILLDYLLPDMDGLEFLQELHTKVGCLPSVIMLTGQGNEQVAVEAMKMGTQDYLVKGQLTAEGLAQAIQRILTHQRLQRMVTRQQQQQQLMANIALRISQSLDLETILNITVEGTRDLLGCDRSLIYRFEADGVGTVIAESVLPPWTVSLGQAIQDTCFQVNGINRYLNGEKTAIANVYQSQLTPCHIQLLEQFQVKANIVVPILMHPLDCAEPPTLWGLLIAHHCRDPRNWKAHELSLLDDLAVQLAIAIQKSSLVSALQIRAERLTTINLQLSQATQQLTKRNRELDEFAYIASHDLKAPLRAIGNLAQWLQDDLADQLSPDNQKQLELMQSRVQRLEKFIEGLLHYSRAGREGLEVVPVNPHALIHEILDELAPMNSLQIVVPEVMPTLQTHKLLLQQVLANLIGNAIKYHNRPDGKIEISMKQLGDKVEFAIADDGPGIAPEYHERIFGIFQTLSSRDISESTGIGLSIVKKIVEQQNGEVFIRSAVGEGSTFFFTWPIQGT